MASDTGTQMRPADLAEALAFLTRFPVPDHEPRGIASAWAWPLAGLAVGLAGALSGLIAFGLGLPAGIAAGLALAATIAASGALHEDGLADCADGFWGGGTTERRLEIMKDSRTGTFGVLALVLSLILRWHALTVLLVGGWFAAPVLAAACLSRIPMAAIMAWLPPARDTGLSARFGRPSTDTVMLGLVAGLIVVLLLTGFAGIPAALAAGAGAGLVALLARSRIGGQTGDVMGATQQVAEIAALAVLAAFVA